ncbi:SDR family NAD(P)-dependent oxidoreductase, partial [Kitasatospora sp. NPDC008050]|uniref:SDR family NAD(P)-dependent oxidoreductase n=1 Tax=Kitasatospora sp. NPDC008050 TaxID=3364021 RepID=UPI0036E27165
TLHVDEPSPHVDWSAGAVELLVEERVWPRTGRPRRSGVSSFGLSGTNAHVILEQAPAVAEAAPVSAPTTLPTVPLLLSARTEPALRGQAERLLSRAGTEPGQAELLDLAYSLATGRAALEHRAVVVADDEQGFLGGLEGLVSGEPGATVVRGSATGGRFAFLFTGQGSQRLGMGAELHKTYPVFAEAYDTVCAELDQYLETPLKEADALIDETAYTQPALFALQVALFRLLESWGVRPDFLAGHSIGELAAAHVAGVLSLADAARLVAARGRLMQALPSGGAMVAVQVSEADVLPLLAGRSDVGIAAVNGLTSVVLSGAEQAVLEVAEQLDCKTKRLTVSHAFHSPLMDPMLAEFRAIAQQLNFSAPTIPIVSTLDRSADLTTADYWVRHVREAVRFADAIEILEREGVRTFVELGPDATLTTLAQDTVSAEDAHFVPTLRADRSEARTLTTALARVHANGAAVDWAAYFAHTGARRVDLPTYAFQRERYWPRPSADAPPVAAGAPDEVDARFWETIEREDLEELTATLGLDGDQPLSAALPALSTWRRQSRARSAVAGWRYQVDWHPVTGSPAAALTGNWLVVTPVVTPAVTPGVTSTATPGVTPAATVPGADESAAAVLATLLGHGAEARQLTLGAADTDRAALADRLRTELAGTGPLAGVVSLLAFDEVPHPAHPALPAGLAATALLVQALGDAELTAPLWCLTRGAVTTGPADRLTNPVQAQVWGLGRVVALEHPDRWGGLIDLPAALDERALARLAETLSDGTEDQVALRASGLLARRLVRSPRSEATGWRPSGTVLVTGGTGALGAQVARWLARGGAEHLVLTSRRGPQAPGAAELRDELTGLGVTVTIAACDVADRAALAGLLGSLERPLSAVVHAAGVVADAALKDSELADLARVIDAKVTGAANLDALLGDTELDAFVTFSSIAGVWGSGGQAAYAAANAFLDALVESRRARGLAGTSVAWGPWGEAGMAAGEAAEEHLRRFGLPVMDPVAALIGLQLALGSGAATGVVADVDWARFAPTFTAARPRPLLGELAEVRQVPADQQATAVPAEGGRATGLRTRLAAMTGADRERTLLELVRGEVATVLGYAGAHAVDPARAFQALGFDSLTAVELRNALNTATGLKLPASAVFDYATPAALAGHLRDELFPDQADAALDPEEAELRQALAAIPLARFREVGLLETLLKLADPGVDSAVPDGGDDLDLIDSLDLDSLIDLALDSNDS